MEVGMIRKAVNLPGWENYPVRAEIERRLGTRVALENDARVATLGEQWLGAARGVANMAVLTLGTGIGGGIVLGGKIWHGMSGLAGEFGHVTIEPEGHPCPCGNRGCSEQYASASAIVRIAREAIGRGEAPSLAQAASSDAEFGALSIYNLAIQGDEPARRIFRNFGRALGLLLATLVNVLNLEMYVIGGGVSSAWDAYAPSMFEELRQRSVVYVLTAPADSLSRALGKEEGAAAPVQSRTEHKTIITRALLGSDAGLYGAARVAVLAG
jgi:glucokinase